MSRPNFNKNTGDSYSASEWGQLKDKCNNPCLNTALPNAKPFDDEYYPDPRTISANETWTVNTTNAGNGNGFCEIITASGTPTLTFTGFTIRKRLISTETGQTVTLEDGHEYTIFSIKRGALYDLYVVDNDNINDSYTFVNTQHMIIDASGEGMTVTNNNLFPSNGSGTDSPMSWELWYKTPAVMSTGRLYAYIADGGVRSCFIGISGTTDRVYMRFEDNGTSNYIQSERNLALSADTLYHIVGTYDGSEVENGLNVYINSDGTSQTRTTNGTYNGIQTSGSSTVLYVPRTDAAIGLGQYQLIRQFNQELTSGEISTLYNSGTPIGLNASLQSKCAQENLFEGNLNADNIGTNGVAVGTPTFGSN